MHRLIYFCRPANARSQRLRFGSVPRIASQILGDISSPQMRSSAPSESMRRAPAAWFVDNQLVYVGRAANLRNRLAAEAVNRAQKPAECAGISDCGTMPNDRRGQRAPQGVCGISRGPPGGDSITKYRADHAAQALRCFKPALALDSAQGSENFARGDRADWPVADMGLRRRMKPDLLFEGAFCFAFTLLFRNQLGSDNVVGRCISISLGKLVEPLLD
jgi:hypothetical protein